MDAAAITAEMHAGAVRELLRAWHATNWAVFREAMRAPTLELSDTESRLGQYDPTHRALSLSKKLVFSQPWASVVEVLKHEMAHQYVFEVLRVTDETSHGAAFQQVCARFGVDARASGLNTAASSDEDDRLLEKVARLLALAESSNENEAEAAMRAAQRLMLKHNLDARTRPSVHVWKTLGEPTGRVQEPERFLANLLTDHFFVEAIWIPVYDAREMRRKTVLEVCGTPANVALAEYVYVFLRDTAERLWVTHKKARNIKLDRDRRKFLTGVMLGFRDKLKDEATKSREAGLVWVRDAALTAYYRARHPRIVSSTFGSGRPSEAYAHGKQAGRDIVLHKPVSSGPSHASPRQLGPKRG